MENKYILFFFLMFLGIGNSYGCKLTTDSDWKLSKEDLILKSNLIHLAKVYQITSNGSSSVGRKLRGYDYDFKVIETIKGEQKKILKVENAGYPEENHANDYISYGKDCLPNVSFEMDGVYILFDRISPYSFKKLDGGFKDSKWYRKIISTLSERK